MASVSHNNALEQLCRLCGSLLKRKYGKTQMEADIKTYVNIDVSKEDVSIYPSSVCLNCNNKLTKLKKGKSTNLVPVEWHRHKGDCPTCSLLLQMKKGGRKSKPVNFGQPKSLSSMTLADVMSLDPKRPIPQAVKNVVGHVIKIETSRSKDPDKSIALPVNNGKNVLFCLIEFLSQNTRSHSCQTLI